MTSYCDICYKEDNFLVDYFCLICQDCKRLHTDITMLRRIGDLIEELERVKQLQECGYSVEDVDLDDETNKFFRQLRGDKQ